MSEQCAKAEIPTVLGNARKTYYKFKYGCFSLAHKYWWGFLHSIGLGWTYSRLLCRYNLYVKFPDGRCQYCGKGHNK